MSLEKLNPWIALIANLGVLVGVVLLLVELRQNTEAIKNQTEYANVSEWMALSREYALTSDLGDIVARGDEGLENLSEDEAFRYFHFVNAYIMISEASFHSIANGTYDYGLEPSDLYTVNFYSHPGRRAVWEMSYGAFSGDYTAYLDRLLAEADAAAEADASEAE